MIILIYQNGKNIEKKLNNMNKNGIIGMMLNMKKNINVNYVIKI